MSLCFGIKMLCDLSVYMIYAQLVCTWLGAPVDGRAPLLLLALAGGLCCLLRERGPARFAPLLLVPASLVFMPSLAGVLVLLAPAAYLGVTAARQLFRIEHSECCDGFRRGCLALLPLAVMPLFGIGELLARVALPLAVLYLSCSVLLLRMLRHAPEVLSRPRFVALNGAVLALALGVAALVSSPAVLNALGAGLGWLYQTLIVPPLMLLGYVAAGFMWVAMRVIQWLNRGSQTEDADKDLQVSLQDNPLLEGVEPVETPELMRALLTTLFIVVCIAAAWWFFRKMLGYRARDAAAPAVAEDRGAAEASRRGERAPRFRPRDPRGAVRWDYRRFLMLERRLGIIVPHSGTSETAADLGKQSFPAEPVDRLSDIYRVARYSEREITHDMAEQTHEAVRELKRRMPKI